MKKKLSIGTCIKIAFGLVLFLMMVIAVISYQLMDRAGNMGSQLYAEYGKTQGEVGMGLAYLQEVKCNLRNALYLYADDSAKQEKAIEAIQTSEDSMYDYLQNAKNGLKDEEALSILQEARDNIDSYISDVDECIRYIQSGKLEDGRKHLLNNGVESANAAEATVIELNTYLDKIAMAAQADFENIQRKGNIIIFGLMILCFGFCIMEVVYLLRQIQKPLVILSAAAGKVALGEINVDLPEKCELREMSELELAFQQMIKNLQEQAAVMKRLSQGDLRAEIIAHSNRDAVGSALAKLIEDDNHTFSAIRRATNQISLGSSQIATASQTLAQGSTEQASAIEQIAASISDIADKTKHNADQADKVNQIVIQAKDDVTAGNDRMREMVAAMNEINEASENIQKIIKVIDDIAFNTNILALNATVEAARAGEQGKGFAVVAEEVRNLAGRSAEASSQTAEMIEDSIRKVKRGGELAKETAEALGVISEMVEKITSLSEDIAKASNEQASATAQIDQALMQVSQVVQTNSATSEQCASASEQLSGQAHGLNQELSKFQLRDVIGNMPSRTLEYSEPEMLETDSMKY